MRRAHIALVGALLVFASAAVAQPPGAPQAPPRAGAPPRDRAGMQTGSAIIRGRVLAADTGKPLRRARVTAAAPELGGEPRATTTGMDGHYEIADLLIASLPDGWILKAVFHDGRDITDAPIEMKSGEELSGVEVIVSDRAATVGGRLVDDTGAPVADGTVLVFASDASRWWEESRWIRAVRADQEGRYEIRGLPAGEYLAVALGYVEDGVWNDPEYLESIRRYAQKLTLKEGGSQSPALKLVTP